MDFEKLMQANLDLVFGERDPTWRIAAIRTIYHEDAELHEPQHSVRGYLRARDYSCRCGGPYQHPIGE
ncbi:hypothetical protein [Chelativorans sp. YIM 93263]|uniref:hypothetical protein n=1 Tax=Chelativorans sp. YIM 93263 TaxID=2906648 RepID=UPI0023788C2C|nr:hypothetical protein [Chelativorans sp. YIM 93263]